jgi:Lsr2
VVGIPVSSTKAEFMQVTFDSAEPLDRVLKVLGSLYSVELTVSGRAGSRGSRSATGSRPAGRGTRGPRRGSAAAASDVREWARANGYEVSERGRMSNALVAAYRDSGGK